MKDRPEKSLRPADSSTGPPPQPPKPWPKPGPPPTLPKPRPMSTGTESLTEALARKATARVRVIMCGGTEATIFWQDDELVESLEIITDAIGEALRDMQARLSTIQGCAAGRLEHIERLEGEAERLKTTLQSSLNHWCSLPAGIDEYAVAEDTSPEDMVAWHTGLAVREIRLALAGLD